MTKTERMGRAIGEPLGMVSNKSVVLLMPLPPWVVYD